MEIKSELLKPYSEKERCDFIVKNSHKLGYLIKEIEDSIQAWGLSSEEEKAQRKQEALQELDAQFLTDKTELVRQFGDALLHEDLEESEAIKAELTELEERYDAEYTKIIGE